MVLPYDVVLAVFLPSCHASPVTPLDVAAIRCGDLITEKPQANPSVLAIMGPPPLEFI